MTYPVIAKYGYCGNLRVYGITQGGMNLLKL